MSQENRKEKPKKLGDSLSLESRVVKFWVARVYEDLVAQCLPCQRKTEPSDPTRQNQPKPPALCSSYLVNPDECA